MSTAHSESARKIVLAKGVFDVFLSLSLIFAPALLYDGPIPLLMGKKTGLATPNWAHNPDSAYGLAALCMGAAFAGIKAGRSYSNEAYQTVATLNGVFALTGLIGCYFLPNTFGSSFLLLASLQDVFWFSAIVLAGNFGIMDTLIGQNVEMLERAKAHAREAGRQGVEWGQEKAGQAKATGQGAVQWGQEKAGQAKATGQDAVQWGQEKGRQGAQWGQEKASVAQEKGHQGAQWGQEKAQAGKAKGQESVQWGQEKGNMKARGEVIGEERREKEFEREHEPVEGVSYAAVAKQ